MNLLVVDYLEKSKNKYGDKVAVIDEYKKYTYNELFAKSQQIASYLVEKISLREPVMVFADKSADTLTAFLGILYAGGFYSLLNPEFPINRIESVSKTLANNIVLCDKEHYDIAKKYFLDKEVLLIEELYKTPILEDKLRKRKSEIIDIDPVYVNFTSGSTGTPKGVLISNRSIIDFIDVFTEKFSITNEDIIANQAPFDFDVSVKDIYSSLKVGATLLIVPKKYFSNPSLLLDYICDNKATTLIWAVSALCLITTFHALDYRVPSDIKKIMFSGEVMPLKHLKEWQKHLPDAMYVNLYGPTEITCNCTYHVLDKTKDYGTKIPIGKPFKNERVFLLDDNDNLVKEPNVIGEICVTGTALALGYYNNLEETNKHFVKNPLNDKYNEIIYRTGDLGMYGEDNDLYFAGRKDFQIKYMGHRIELEEIEMSINQVDGVERCCCIFDTEKSKLYAFYQGNIDKVVLYSILKEQLPIFMIPSKLTKIDGFPLNKNGKIDRKKLKEEVFCS